MSGNADTSLRESLDELWYLKDIIFKPDDVESAPRTLKIITQNYNGSVRSVRCRLGVAFIPRQAVFVYRNM